MEEETCGYKGLVEGCRQFIFPLQLYVTRWQHVLQIGPFADSVVMAADAVNIVSFVLSPLVIMTNPPPLSSSSFWLPLRYCELLLFSIFLCGVCVGYLA
jgi:hypothetical protein